MEFLRNLPEYDNSQGSIESGSALKHLTLDDTLSSSLPTPSRFLTFTPSYIGLTPTLTRLEGRVIFTAFLVPHKKGEWGRNTFEMLFNSFPTGSEFMTAHPDFYTQALYVWFTVLTDDYWIENKFGKLEPTKEENQERTIFCHFYLWPFSLGATLEQEEASAVDPKKRASWNEAIAQVMPPATASVQERWDIREVPRFYPPESELEFDPDEDPEYAMERLKLRDEYLQFHGL